MSEKRVIIRFCSHSLCIAQILAVSNESSAIITSLFPKPIVSPGSPVRDPASGGQIIRWRLTTEFVRAGTPGRLDYPGKLDPFYLQLLVSGTFSFSFFSSPRRTFTA